MASLIGAAAPTTGTTPEEADITTVAALRAAAVVVAASSGVVAVVVAAADETRQAEARRAKPSQARKSREGLTNGFGYFVMVERDRCMIVHKAQGMSDHRTSSIR